jgi:hypothetical protein
MSFEKIANAELKEPILSTQDWSKLYGTRTFGQKTAAFNKIAADQSKYLLSHCTIMSSLATEAPPFDYLVRPSSSHLFNNNDDGWSNPVLRLSHRSFVGAFNFVEHFQNSKYAKGHILDSVLRKIHLGPEAEDWVYFCDILVATDLAHEKLINDIRNGEVRYLSMGCVTDLVICSFCGAHVTDQSSYCVHLNFQKGQFLLDDDGISRRVGELCGHHTLPNGGVKFVEASWVGTPAFPGAVKRSIVSDEWVGPKTPYTRKSSSLDGITKAASEDSEYRTPNLGEVLMQEDDLRGRSIR